MSKSMDNTEVIKMCQICNDIPNKYCCPKCNVLYCSINCYKSPSHAQCSENFYKECFTNELSSMDNDPESKKKMMDILQRMHQTDDPMHLPETIPNSSKLSDDENFYDVENNSDRDSDDDESVPDLADRLKDINLDDSEAVWELLTEDEKKEFEALTKDDVAKILPVWKPWWLFHMEKKLITPIENDEPFNEQYVKLCPDVNKNIISFLKISATKPSPCIKYNILNVLSSYIYMARLFNGDYHDACIEAATCFTLLSNNLNKETNFNEVEIAIESVIIESLNNPGFSCNESDKIQLEYDLKCFFKGPQDSNRNFYFLCAFSDSILLLNNLKKYSYPTKITKKPDENSFSKKFHEPDALSTLLPKSKVKSIIKKLEYYLSFIQENSAEIFNLYNEYFL